MKVLRTAKERRLARATTIIDNDVCSLRYYRHTKIVHHELRKFIQGEQLREVLEKGLEIFKQHGAFKWLSDDRGNGPLKPADEEWALKIWAPRVMKAGWKFWAVVLPEKVLGQMNMRRWIQAYSDQGVTAAAFTDPEEAMVWLEQQNA